MAHRIESIMPGSIAEELALCPGDELHAINGEPVLDQIDYQALSACEELVLTVKTGGELIDIELSKDAEEPLGLIFGSTLMSKPRVCKNKCQFCFIDQMPKGLRKSLYVKDDDWRLSLMMGNYITLTNLDEPELRRILKRRASPMYLSIHTTDGALRTRMMGNPHAADIFTQLQRLKAGGIRFHAQIVLCPGLNDGAALDHTLSDLLSLAPAALSAALVPVGLTSFRTGLAPLTPFAREGASRLLRQAMAWQKVFLEKLGTRFVFPADEFYCIAGEPVPADDIYEGFPQIENGVGLLASFRQAFLETLAEQGQHAPGSYTILTGVSAAPFLKDLLEGALPQDIRVRVQAVENRFFGNTVTVAGLLTGSDLLEAAKAAPHGDTILIPRSTLRHEGDRFLDDMPLTQVEAVFGGRLRVVDAEGSALAEALCGILKR